MTKNKLDRKIYKNLSVFFATFAPFQNKKMLPTNGMVEGTLFFFVPRIKKFHIVIQPHPGSDRINPIVERYEEGKLLEKKNFSEWFYFPIYLICKLQKEDKTYISYKLRDFISVLTIGIKEEDPYDFLIGLESINTIAGICLKKLGKVKKVIYRVSDYSPDRYKNRLFNFFYLLLDRFCARHADYIWDVSPAMQPARVKAGLNSRKSAPHFVVPNGLFKEQVSHLPVEKRIPYSFVYMGTLHYVNGPDLAIEIMPEVKKKFPGAKLHIIGGGEVNMKRIKKLVKDLKVSDSVIFHGFVVDNIEMARLVEKCYIALAPYRAEDKSFRWYADATKIRQYLGSGLPVVTTQVPPLGKIIAAKGAGLVTTDTKEQFGKAVMKLLSDKKLYLSMTKKAIELSRENTWEKEYIRAFKKININLSF